MNLFWEKRVVGCVRGRSGSSLCSRDIACDSENITACVKFSHCGPCLCWQLTNREETWLRSAGWMRARSSKNHFSNHSSNHPELIQIKDLYDISPHQLCLGYVQNILFTCLQAVDACFAKLAPCFPLIGQSFGYWPLISSAYMSLAWSNSNADKDVGGGRQV